MRTIILFVLAFAVSLSAQELANNAETYSAGVTLDSTASTSIYFEFYSRSKSVASTTAFNPANSTRRSNDLVITGQIDSLKASNVSDSTTYKVAFLDHDGYLTGESFWLDFTNNDTSNVAVQNTFTPFNRSTATRGSSSATFWADLSGLIKPHYYGIKLTIVHTADGASTDSTLHRPTLHHGLGGFRN